MKLANIEAEYAKNKDLRKEDVKSLQEWLQKQPHLPSMSELELILFLHSCYYSVEFTKTTIDTYYTLRAHIPEFFANRDPNLPSVRQLFNTGLNVMLPKRTPEGYTVLFCKLMDTDPDNFVLADTLKGFDMTMVLHLHQEGTSNGQILLFDMQGVVFGHLAKLDLMTVKKTLLYVQEAVPVRLKGLHFINVVPFMDKIMTLMRPFIKKELLDLICLHTDGLESLYKYVPKECLPKDYGGTADSLIQLHEYMKKTILENAEFFIEDEKKIADESKRPGKAKNLGDIFGVEGTFRKLDID